MSFTMTPFLSQNRNRPEAVAGTLVSIAHHHLYTIILLIVGEQESKVNGIKWRNSAKRGS